MVELTYKDVSAILDLVDVKLSSLKDKKYKRFEATTNIPAFRNKIPEDPKPIDPYIYSDDEDDHLIKFYEGLRDKLDNEVNRIKFRFGSSDEKER